MSVRPLMNHDPRSTRVKTMPSQPSHGNTLFTSDVIGVKPSPNPVNETTT